MRKSFSNRSRGFTLPEIIVSAALFTIVGLGTATLFKEIFSGSKQKSSALASVDQARLVAGSFVNEMRNSTAGNDGGYPLNEASSTEVILYTAYGASAPAVNRVRYFSSGSTLYKGVTVPSGNPLAYNLANEKVSAVQSSLANGSSPLFSYYDDSYNGSSTPLSQPVNINSVNFVQMNLKLLIQNVRNATTTFSLSAGATIRGLKSNLGN